MALQTKTYSTGSFDRYGESRGYVLELVLTQQSADWQTNTSQVDYQLRLCSGANNRFDWEMTAALTLCGKPVATVTEEKYLDYNDVWVLLSGTTRVSHGENGSLDMAFSATLTPWNGGNSYTPPALELSGTMPLTDISPASQVAATAACIGDGATVVVSRKDPTYTHSIHYQFGGLSGYLADAAGTVSDTEQRLTETVLVFPLPESFYGQIPGSPTGVCTLTCRTYSGDQLLGQPRTATFTVTADPARCRPVLSAAAEDINENTLLLTGNSRIFVEGYSTVRCTVEAAAQKGAVLQAIYLNEVLLTEPVYTLQQVESSRITLRAVDSRGYETQYTVPGLELVPYAPADFHAAASRTDPTSGGGLLQLTGKWHPADFGSQTNQLTGQYRIDSGDWQSFTVQTEGENIATEIALTGLDYRTGHRIQIRLTDKLSTATATASVSKGIPVFDWGEEDVCFRVPVIFTATDGSRFSLDLVEDNLQIRRQA